jgi:hypothetical protein
MGVIVKLQRADHSRQTLTRRFRKTSSFEQSPSNSSHTSYKPTIWTLRINYSRSPSVSSPTSILCKALQAPSTALVTSPILLCPILLRSRVSKLTSTDIAVLSLAEKQKALEQYADTAEAQKFVSQAPIPNQQQQLTQPQIQYIQAAPTPQAQQARKAKILRNPVVWQITEQQLKELQWKRKQLLQAQKADLERKKAARAKRPPAPKLGPSKNASRAGSVVASSSKAPQAKVPQPQAPQAKQAPPKPSQVKPPHDPRAKTAAKAPQAEKAPMRK